MSYCEKEVIRVVYLLEIFLVFFCFKLALFDVLIPVSEDVLVVGLFRPQMLHRYGEPGIRSYVVYSLQSDPLFMFELVGKHRYAVGSFQWRLGGVVDIEQLEVDVTTVAFGHLTCESSLQLHVLTDLD